MQLCFMILILNKHVRSSRWLVLASFLWDLCTHWRADFVLRAQKRQLQWTVHKTLMSVYTCLVITCKWPTGGHFWLCDRKNHLHMWCLSVSLAPHLSPRTSVFLSFSPLRFWSWLHSPPSSRLVPPPPPHQDGTFRSYGMQTISAPGKYIVAYLIAPIAIGHIFIFVCFRCLFCLWNDT